MIIRTRKSARKIYFEGNSLSNYGPGNILNGHYMPRRAYGFLTAYNVAMKDLAVSARTQTMINADVATNILSDLRKGDVIVLWEGTNDIRFNTLTGAQGWANVVTYSNIVRPAGAKLIVCTITARDFSLDDADLMDRIDAYNVLARANPSVYDALCDLAADPVFDTRADASNTTYYNADKLHFTQAGYDKVADLLYPVIQSTLT